MKKFRILVSRPDRLGDVILSTPVLSALQERFPHAEITFLVQDFVAPVVRGLPQVSEVLVYEPRGRHSGFSGFWRLVKDLRERQFRSAVALQSTSRVAWAIRFAGIRYRVGPYSKLHSWLTYNRGIRQRRSQVEMHETDYNLQLLRRVGVRAGTRKYLTQVAISSEARTWAHDWLAERGWGSDGAWVLVHPGMGGSALNWPESHYVELVRTLADTGVRVLLTGGPTEADLLGRLRQAVLEGDPTGARAGRVVCFGGAESGPVDRLGALMSRAAVVVAPSTGPLHLAVALNRRVVSFYPPIRVQSAVRWGPYVKEDSQASVLVPQNYCGEDFRCRGSLCHYFPCMKSLTVSQVLEQVRFQLSR